MISPSLITFEEALARVLDAAVSLEPVDVAPDDAVGRVLAADVCADRDYPPFDRAMMDGFAVRVGDAGKSVQVVGEVAAAQWRDTTLAQGTAVAIMTGAACPPETDAVVPKERVVTDGGVVRLPDSIERDQNIARHGIECAKGEVVLRAGAVVTPLHRAVIATVGAARIRVIPRAAVRVIATGSELVGEGAVVERGQIRLSNGPMLRGLVESAGAACVDEVHVPDDKDAIQTALMDVGAKCVVTIISGGASAGKYDLVDEVLREIGAEIRFHGVAQRPGKPMMFATLGERLLFGLSGNPMACLVGFHAYALPALRKLMGMESKSFDYEGVMNSGIDGHDSYTWFMTAQVAFEGGRYRVSPIEGKGSADMFSSVQANVLLQVPPKARLRAGDTISFQFLLGSNIC